MAKEMIEPRRSEAEYDTALKDIERYFEKEPGAESPEANRFDLLAAAIEDYEKTYWPIDPPDTVAAG